jgi:hypothetical protein
MKLFKLIRNHSGVSMAEMMVATAMAGALALVLAQLSKNSAESQSRIEAKADDLIMTNNINSLLTNGTACNNTLAFVDTAGEVTSMQSATPTGGLPVANIRDKTNGIPYTVGTKLGKAKIDAMTVYGLNTAAQTAKMEIKTSYMVGRNNVKARTKTVPLNVVTNAAATDVTDCSTAFTGGAGNDWSISGNTGTVDATDFIGTTDNVPFNVRVNNLPSGKIDPTLLNSSWGYRAFRTNTTGSKNVAVGYQALQSNTDGYHNTAVGTTALQASATSGGYIPYGNTAIGSTALAQATNAVGNTAVGYASLPAVLNGTTGNFNTGVGFSALYNLNSGTMNTALGTTAGQSTVTGSGNTFLGKDAGVGANNMNYSISIGMNSGAYGDDAIAIGGGSTYGTPATDGAKAYGRESIAIGGKQTVAGTAASPNHATIGAGAIAIGSNVSAAAQGSMALGDSNTTILSNNMVNNFKSRFSGGYTFYNDSTMTAGESIVIHNGNMGVGVLYPTAPLHVSHTFGATDPLVSGSKPLMRFDMNPYDDGANILQQAILVEEIVNNTYGDQTFGYYGSSSTIYGGRSIKTGATMNQNVNWAAGSTGLGVSGGATTGNASVGDQHAVGVYGSVTANTAVTNFTGAWNNGRLRGGSFVVSGDINANPSDVAVPVGPPINEPANVTAIYASDRTAGTFGNGVGNTYAGWFDGKVKVFSDTPSLGRTGFHSYIKPYDLSGITTNRAGFFESTTTGAFQFGIKNIGVQAVSYASAISSEGRSYGVWGRSGNATPGYNYGVYGEVTGTNAGAGIFGVGAGASDGFNTSSVRAGLLAGFFQGDVAMTGFLQIPTAGHLVYTSDIRLKKDIKTLNHSLEKISKIRGVSYYWKDEEAINKSKDKQIGLIAQEVEAQYPEAVSETKREKNGITEKIKVVSYQVLIGPIIEAIKELHAKVVALFKSTDDHEKRIRMLEQEKYNREIASVKAENEKLKREHEEMKQILCAQKVQASFCKKK